MAGPSGPAFLYNFYPRSPCGERLSEFWTAPNHQLFLSTLSLRRATTLPNVSIDKSDNFYPRSPCGERPMQIVIVVVNALFLSTLSLRRATRLPTALRTPHHKFLSTLSLRRATAKVHKTVGHFCAYETNFMEIASSC